MESQARKLEGSVHSFTASTFNFFGRLWRKALARLAAPFGVLGILAFAALVVAVGSVPVSAQTVQFFGSFQSYNQTFAQNAQGLVANAQGEIYVSGSHALGYVPVDVNGVPIESGEVAVPGYPSQGHVMGMAIDASNNIFRADPASPNGPAVEMFTYNGSPTSSIFSYIGTGWTEPTSVTVDSLSNVYVLDGGTGTIVMLTPNGLGGYTPSTLFTSSDLINTTGLSMDSAGDFYVASGSNYGAYPIAAPTQTAVYKITNHGDSNYTLSTIGTGWSSPSATSVDAAGNVWVVDCGAELNCGAGTINLLVPNGGSSYNQTVYQNISGIRTLMVNQAGKLYGLAYNLPSDALIVTGGTPPHNLGTYNVGTAASSVTVTVDFMSPATAGGFNVTTQGASTGDFQATGGTCAAGSYTASQSCTVEVAFTPQAPGMRTGALVVTDGSGNVLGTNYFYGTGVAPSIAFQPGTFSAPIPNGSGLAAPFGAALDQAGNLYVTAWYANTLTKFAAGSLTPTALDSTLNEPAGMTVDGAGNLWVAECGNNDVVLETSTSPGVYAKSVPFSSLGCPYDVAVDGSGNVYIAELQVGDVLKETLNNGSYAQSTVVSGLTIPMAVAVDSSSNVYVADTGNHRVLEETPSGSSYVPTIVANSGLSDPEGLAIDPNGNVYISDSSNARIVEATPSGGTFVQSTLLTTGMTRPVGLALDAAGDLYIADINATAIEELNVSTAPTFAFASTVAGGESSDSPKTTTLFNYGNATLNISTISIPAGFSSDTTTCALTSETLTANTSCLLGIDFMPTSGVPYIGTVTIADDHLNVPATQTIGLSGTGLLVTLSPASETLPAGTVGVAYSQTFSASSGSSPYTYVPTITSGAMPAGLSFSGGVLSGTPSASGSVTFSIVATDNSPSPGPYSSTSQSYSLTVNAPPTVLSISPGSLPDGALGIPYSQNITASGGSGSYTYAVTSGRLPAWLSLNASTGALSGTPTIAGPNSFTITATDTIANVAASQAYAPTIYAIASAAPTQNAGPSNIGSPASTTTLTFTFNVPATVASINVVTQGAANKDFTNAGTGTCTAVAYSATSTCTVDVTFTPQYAGTRYGAVLLEDASGHALGTALIDGIGTGPQIVFGAGTATATALAPAANDVTLNKPTGIVLDGAGDLFIADIENNRVVEMPAGGGMAQAIAPTVNGRLLNHPAGLAVDGAGNLFIADVYNWRVVKVSAHGGAATAIAPTVNGTPLNNPVDIALDGAGNLFISDTWNNRIVEVSVGGAATALAPVVNGLPLSRPSGIAVDGAGNLFISDTLNARVVEVPSNGGAAMSIAPTVNAIALNHPSGITVDGAGDLFIADTFNNRVVEVAGDGSGATAFVPAANGATLVQPNGLALDGAGSLFVSDHGNRRVMKLQRSLPPALSFASTAVGLKSSDSPQFVAVENTGNATLTFSGLSTATDFPLDSSGASVCASTTSLAAGASCTLPIDFIPATVGAKNGTLTLIDNSLDGNPVTQNITLSGTAIQASPTLTWPTASAILYGQTLASSNLSGGTSTPAGTFTWTTASTAPGAGTASESVIFLPTDTADYNSATGTVSLTVNKATATVALSGLSQTYTGSALAATATTNPASLNVSLTYNGSSTVPSAAGSYAVVGTINDTNYTGTASGTLVISTAASAVSVAPSANPAVLMDSVTLTATVRSTAGTPAGQVSFLDGTTPLGSVAVSGGVATFTTATLATGAHSITANYVASADFAASSSSSLSLTVIDLSLGNTGGSGSGSTGPSQTTTPGGSASYTVALAPSAGTTFPNAITLTVTGLPSGATATLGTPGWTEQSPTSWTLPANQLVSNISLTFQAPAQTAAAEPNDGPGRKLPWVAMGILLLPFARKWRKAGKRMSRWLCLLLIAAGMTAATSTTGCGGSSTPPQTYNVTVTVTAGALTHSTQLILTVK